MISEEQERKRDTSKSNGSFKVPSQSKMDAIIRGDDMEHKFEPFERVLVRDMKANLWKANLFSNLRQIEDEIFYDCIGSYYKYCIPYAGNEHLLGTTDSPEQKYEYKWGDKIEYLNSLEAWAPAIFVEKMSDGCCLILIKRGIENVLSAVESEKEIRPLKEEQQ